MSQAELSDSRFHMWRAVFAMAHVDGRVSDEEAAFAEKYLANAPFSDGQKAVLREDLKEPKRVAEMLKHVSAPEDQADFFQFSQMLAWADGDYSAQERALVEKMQASQMESFDRDAVAQNIRNARKASILRRAVEDDAFSEQARDVSGFANVIRFVAPWVGVEDFEAPDAEMFKLWRAVFSLVHVDGEVSGEERDYIDGMMDVFHFSDKQRQIVDSDIQTPGEVVGFFDQISSVRHRRQFFILARTIVWCDGVFHDDERAALDSVKAHLGADVDSYASEIRWLDRRPDTFFADANDPPQEAMMKSVVRQMIDFYRASA
ncbi:MAG: hypothetical protein ACPGRX_08380 [Bdellovibrionales bacterium]